jgi:hypothetical protein
MSDDNKVMVWLQKLAGCQWSQAEMRDGTAWQNLLPVIQNIK